MESLGSQRALGAPWRSHLKRSPSGWAWAILGWWGHCGARGPGSVTRRLRPPLDCSLAAGLAGGAASVRHPRSLSSRDPAGGGMCRAFSGPECQGRPAELPHFCDGPMLGTPVLVVSGQSGAK